MEQDPMELALSTDIVMDVVLSYLKAGDVLSCRLVSKFWNKAASSVLRRRYTMIKKISDEKQLMELEECLRESSDFPFAGLKLDQPSALNSDRGMEFFQNYGVRFTRLCLDTQWEHRLHVLAPFIDHLPCLSILETGRRGRYPSGCYPTMRRYYPKEPEDGKILKLSSVRTLRIFSYLDVNEDVLRQVLLAASPSVQIECLDATPEILRALANVGKLRAVTSIRFDVDEDDEDWDPKESQVLSIESPTLTKLDFNTAGCLSLDGLMKILFSSQQTLKELRLNGLRLSEYSWDKFPVLAKLTTLRLCVEIEQERQYLFQGQHGPKFPALKELELEIPYDGENLGRDSHLSDGLFIVPTLTRIDLKGYVSQDRIKELAQTFPNVVEVGLQYGYYSGQETGDSERTCGSNPFEIWSVREFEHLEKLRIWDFAIKRPTKNYVNMDSFLTGISVGVCQNLRKQEHLMLNLINSPFGEAFSQVIRDNPNILQLKNLRELVVCVHVGVHREFRLKELLEDTSFMSMVSMSFALKMMPNLRARFVHYGSSPCPRLEAAFQDVQEYIKLESYFY